MLRRLIASLAVLLVLPAGARAQAEAPPAPPPDADGAGGARFGVITGLQARIFSVAPGTVVAGAPLTVSFRISGPTRRVRARVALLARGARRPVAVLRLGVQRTGITVTRRWTPDVKASAYTARLVVRARGGGRLVRTPATPGSFPVTFQPAPAPAPIAATSSGVFPIRGSWSFGGAGARFGARRRGHVHQGQDIFAPEATPLVSPVTGTVAFRKVQPEGAGHYLVIRDGDGRDYVFMHLVAGSETVSRGDPVRAGQQIGQVGHTGDADGSHLHFEIWPDGWYAPDSEPIDPLPALKAWAAAGAGS